MSNAKPLTEIKDGQALWRVQVESPQNAAEGKVEAAFAVLPMPQGAVLAGCLKIYDQPGRPQLSHAFGALSDEEVKQWLAQLVSRASLKTVFERRDWKNEFEKDLAMDPLGMRGLIEDVRRAPLGQDPQGAMQAYYSYYQKEFARLGSAEVVWLQLRNELAAPQTLVHAGSRSIGLMILGILLLASGVVLAALGKLEIAAALSGLGLGVGLMALLRKKR